MPHPWGQVSCQFPTMFSGPRIWHHISAQYCAVAASTVTMPLKATAKKLKNNNQLQYQLPQGWGQV